MKVKFISNACCIVETNTGTQILTDPWIENGVFEGSWCHFHKLKTIPTSFNLLFFVSRMVSNKIKINHKRTCGWHVYVC